MALSVKRRFRLYEYHGVCAAGKTLLAPTLKNLFLFAEENQREDKIDDEDGDDRDDHGRRGRLPDTLRTPRGGLPHSAADGGDDPSERQPFGHHHHDVQNCFQR